VIFLKICDNYLKLQLQDRHVETIKRNIEMLKERGVDSHKKNQTKTNGEKKKTLQKDKKNKNKIKKIKREAGNIFVLLTEGDNVYIFMKQLV
jgi:hypothetical protein